MINPSDKTVATLVRLLQALRIRENLSLESAADLAGIHRTHLGLLERGERQPTLSVALKLASALGFELSELLLKAELIEKGKLSEKAAFVATYAREERIQCIRNERALIANTGLTSPALVRAVHSCYNTLDTIDSELIANAVQPVASLVELANLSSMVGNLLAASIADSSEGLYLRNRPHAYPDLLSQKPSGQNLELKMALESNRPKGHLPKAGQYVTFRYVLGDAQGNYVRGKQARGNTVWIWEIKTGFLSKDDFDESNTQGDSGKTATIKTDTFNQMPLVYFDQAFCPYSMRNGSYPGFN
jgi:transcriptional regulator with XRE-family HTH domain